MPFCGKLCATLWLHAARQDPHRAAFQTHGPHSVVATTCKTCGWCATLVYRPDHCALHGRDCAERNWWGTAMAHAVLKELRARAGMPVLPELMFGFLDDMFTDLTDARMAATVVDEVWGHRDTWLPPGHPNKRA